MLKPSGELTTKLFTDCNCECKFSLRLKNPIHFTYETKNYILPFLVQRSRNVLSRQRRLLAVRSCDRSATPLSTTSRAHF